MGREGIFFLFYCIQIGPEAHPAFFQWVLRLKQLEHEAEHSPSSSAKVNVRSYTSTPPHLHGVGALLSTGCLHSMVLGYAWGYLYLLPVI
jgi:hypothetical protein